jgi:hypothetical protein
MLGGLSAAGVAGVHFGRFVVGGGEAHVEADRFTDLRADGAVEALDAEVLQGDLEAGATCQQIPGQLSTRSACYAAGR